MTEDLQIGLALVGLLALAMAWLLSRLAIAKGHEAEQAARSLGVMISVAGWSGFYAMTSTMHHGTLFSPALLLTIGSYPLVAVRRGTELPGRAFTWAVLATVGAGCVAGDVLPLSSTNIALQEALLFRWGLMLPPGAALAATLWVIVRRRTDARSL